MRSPSSCRRSRLGVFAIAADLQNFGEQENTTDPSVPSTGTVLTRSFVLSGSLAIDRSGSRTAAGIALKVVQMRVDCTGPCDFPNEVAQTFAIDGGAQFAIGVPAALCFGASVRNLGLALEVQDSEESDPLPTRVQVGLLYRYPLPGALCGGRGAEHDRGPDRWPEHRPAAATPRR